MRIHRNKHDPIPNQNSEHVLLNISDSPHTSIQEKCSRKKTLKRFCAKKRNSKPEIQTHPPSLNAVAETVFPSLTEGNLQNQIPNFLIPPILNRINVSISPIFFPSQNFGYPHYSSIQYSFFQSLSLIHISEPTRPLYISYAVFCLKKKKKNQTHSTIKTDKSYNHHQQTAP
eukprot:TRINITY_DN13477_c0_g1_i1.p2 TRINITY_DN13477_c0_g1~~TRINITY_DN13477_c0_g1_i1.p2  ORF type:complete len:172 (-),score=19.35 TRINITY_DN13477_c0_g1_i1:1-516(-)